MGSVGDDWDVGLAIRCHGCAQELALRCRWQASTETVGIWTKRKVSKHMNGVGRSKVYWEHGRYIR